MEIVEIVIYIAISIMIGGMIVYFLIDWDTDQTYEGLSGVVYNDQQSGYEKVDKNGFISALHKTWVACGYGEVEMTVPVYVTGSGTLKKEEIFEELKKLNYCSQIQSAEFECGVGEDVEMKTITLPQLVVLSCTKEDTIGKIEVLT